MQSRVLSCSNLELHKATIGRASSGDNYEGSTCWKVLTVFIEKKHNAGLNMRHKHSNQTITAALEGQSNTL